MRKQHLPLTKDQIKRGVYFSSQLINTKTGDEASIHEIMNDESNEEKKRRTALLLNDSFFDGDANFKPIWNVNIIRE